MDYTAIMGIKRVIVENLQDPGVALEPSPDVDAEPRGKNSEKDRGP